MTAPDFSGHSLADLHSLSGRVAFVTGAARGIGAAIASRLVEAGAIVVLGDQNLTQAEDTASRIGGGAAAVHVDVTSATSVAAAIDTAEVTSGPIDILVNNAGLLAGVSFVTEFDDDLYERVMAVNVRGALNCGREVARRMIEARRSGVIVNIGSTASYRVPNPGTVIYTASKHALNAVTKTMALELGPHGIRVLDIAPTMVETPGIEELRSAALAKRAESDTGGGVKLGNPDAFANLPLGRCAVPDDVARVAAFCVSDAAAMMTGCTIPVDAGSMTAR